MVKFTNKKNWARECAKIGAVNHIAEITTYTDLGQEHMQEYAVCTGNRGLCGHWHPIANYGVVYNVPRNCFSTKDRKFVQEKLSNYM